MEAADNDDAGADTSVRLGGAGAPASDGFLAFYRQERRGQLKRIMMWGASLDEAETALSVAMQELMLRWSEVTNPDAYVARVARNALSRIRKEESRRRQLEQAVLTPEVGDVTEVTVWEDNDWVLRMLGQLPPAQRTAMALAFDGYSPAEIGDLLGSKPAAVRKNLELARSRLRTQVMRERGVLPRQPRRVAAPAAGREAGGDQ